MSLFFVLEIEEKNKNSYIHSLIEVFNTKLHNLFKMKLIPVSTLKDYQNIPSDFLHRYYKLDYDDKRDIDIGNILNNGYLEGQDFKPGLLVELREKHGIKFSLAYDPKIILEMQEKISKGDAEILLEEVLWKFKNNKEKATTICNYFNENINVLYIIDQYFLKINSTEKDDYLELIKEIISRLNPKKIEILTKKKNIDKKLLNSLKEGFDNLIITIKYCDNWHDRFWYTDQNEGFCMGTSLNGIGKKISSIHKLSDNDINEIKNIAKNIL